MTEEYALWKGTYYGYTCLVEQMKASVPEAGRLKIEFSEIKRIINNLTIDASETTVSAYLASTYDITLLKHNKFNFLPLRQIERGAYDELKPMVAPEGDPAQQGKVNVEAFLYECQDAVLMIEPEVSDMLDYFRKILREQFPNAVVPENMLDILKECPSKEGGTEDFLTEEVPVEVPSLTSSENVSRTYYSGDYMTRRRPPGEFFLVDMIAPPTDGGSPVPMDLIAPDGTPVTCLQLNMLPSSLVINGAKKINRSQTMTRWVEEHWGDELDQISFSGSTFAFINFNGEGLCANSRHMTEPYKELQHFVNIYKLNGCVYQGPEISAKESPRTFFNYEDPATPFRIYKHPRVGLIKARLHIRIRCDFLEAIGYFESFDVVESANTPHSLNYSISFKSEHTTWR